MQTSTVRLYSLPYREAKTYGIALLFVAGNIILPQLFHLIPQGGITWLPIYFFTLIAAYKYGWKVGLLTAVLSPVANALFFGMPGSGSFARHSHEIGIARHSLRDSQPHGIAKPRSCCLPPSSSSTKLRVSSANGF